MESLGLTYNIKTRRNYLFLAITVSLGCIGLLLWNPVFLAVLIGAVFVGLFFSSRTFRWVVFPAIIAFNQMIYGRWGFPINFGGLTILPTDWIAFLLIGAVFLSKIFKGERMLERTGIEWPTGLFLGALVVVSLFGVVSIKTAMVGIGHIALYFLTFYCMVMDWEKVPVASLWRSYQLWAIPVAVSIVWGFLASGGGRSLGISFNLRFSDLILPVICFQLVSLTLKGGVKRLLLLGLLVLAVVASQTRGAWISLAIVVLIWALIRIFLGDGRFSDRVIQIGSVLLRPAVMLALVFLMFSPFLGHVEERATQLVGGTGTIILRLFLWGLALKVFILHPITGIGLWQFPEVIRQLPEMKSMSIFTMVQGFSTHNSFLQLLAETGVIGATAFLFFCFAVLRLSWQVAKSSYTIEEKSLAWGIFLTLFFFIISTFYAEAWIMYPFMFFLALLVILEKQLNRRAKFKSGN